MNTKSACSIAPVLSAISTAWLAAILGLRWMLFPIPTCVLIVWICEKLFKLYGACQITSELRNIALKSYRHGIPGRTRYARTNEKNPNMKRYSSIIHIVSLVCACLIFNGCATNQAGLGNAPAPANSGHLIVTRVANFGTDLSLVLSVDGKDVGSFSEGRNYDGYLPAGQHVITARPDPNRNDARPGRITLTVKAGQTYSYTAAWSGQNLALVRNQYYT